MTDLTLVSLLIAFEKQNGNRSNVKDFIPHARFPGISERRRIGFSKYLLLFRFVVYYNLMKISNQNFYETICTSIKCRIVGFHLLSNTVTKNASNQ